MTGIVTPKIQLAELWNEVYTLQRALQEKVWERRARVEKKKCYMLHEVKNALTGILSCAEILGTGNLEPDEQEEFLQIVAHEIDRVVGMTQEFRECADEQQRVLKFRTSSVKRFVQDLLLPIQRDFTSRKISIHTDLYYTGSFEIDSAKMKQVFMNILNNARDAMPEGGSLTITSRLVKGMIQFEIIDTGCGMSPELQMRMFEPLVTEGKPFGTGLGMAIAKEILDEHHGHIEVESIVAQGTTIRISLPLIQSSGKT